jgi:hypothetical protein
MPCNCGKKANTKFVYVDASGKTITYDTEVQAKAAMIRAGGKGEVKPVGR